MKNLARLLPALVLAVAAAPARADRPDAQALAQQARAVLQAHCADCHGGGKAAKGGFGFVLDRDKLLARLLVVPGKAKGSDLFQRVHAGEMPPPARKKRPGPAELLALQRWIDAGAPPFDPPSKAALPETAVPAVVLADLDRLDPRQRRFTRYLTLTHLAFAGRSEKDLHTVREAAAKLVNSLSWHPRLSLPEPVDPAGTVLRIDLRAYKWTAAQWERLATAYPYRLTPAADARAFAALAGTEVPAVRADWFVATASRPPFYYDLVQMPATDRGLERLLQVDVVANVQDDNLIRAGFNDSGVSKNNRLIERHDAAHGALWRSHDFAGNTGRQNLFEHPLGPNAGATSFRPDGGEAIFHLPNGLQAYIIVDGAGRRIDKAPGEVVADPRRPDQRVEAGVSCMSCHARGLLPKADQVRPHVEKNANVFGKLVVDAVRAAHPRKAAFLARIDEDNVRYLRALERFGVRDPDDEPVNLVTQRFEATLDGRSGAAELGLTVEGLGKFLKQHPDLARTFGGLLAAGGTSQRQTFEEGFPELARRLLEAPAGKPEPAAASPFKGHVGVVNGVAFSPDGQRAASGGDDRTVRVWEVATGRELAVLTGGGEVLAVAFSPDGKLILSAGRDRLLCLWDVEAGKQIRSFRGHTDAVRCVAFSPDGKQAASGGDDRTVRVWDIAAGREAMALAGHAGAVTSVAWSPRRARLLSGSLDGTARVWDLRRGRELGRLEGHTGPVLSVAFSPDGGTALTGGNDRTVRVWAVSQVKELHALQGHANAVIHVQFSPDGATVLSASGQHRGPDDNWRRWDAARGVQLTSRAAGADFSFGCAAFSPDGRRVLAGGPGGFLRPWDVPQ